MNRRGFFKILASIGAAALGDLLPIPKRTYTYGGGKVYGHINFPVGRSILHNATMLPMREWVGRVLVIYKENDRE